MNKTHIHSDISEQQTNEQMHETFYYLMARSTIVNSCCTFHLKNFH